MRGVEVGLRSTGTAAMSAATAMLALGDAMVATKAHTRRYRNLSTVSAAERRAAAPPTFGPGGPSRQVRRAAERAAFKALPA